MTECRSCVKGGIIHKAAGLRSLVWGMKKTDVFIQRRRFKAGYDSYDMMSFYCKYRVHMYFIIFSAREREWVQETSRVMAK